MGNSKNTQSGGIGFATLLGIVFIILKLTETIDWSWWWVLSPFWIGPAIVLFVLVLIFILSNNKKIKRLFKFKK